MVGGMHGREACMAEGMHGGRMHGKGVCMVEGACMAGGMCYRGGIHTPPTHTMRYGRSMRWRYASYWNAFLYLMHSPLS